MEAAAVIPCAGQRPTTVYRKSSGHWHCRFKPSGFQSAATTWKTASCAFPAAALVLGRSLRRYPRRSAQISGLRSALCRLAVLAGKDQEADQSFELGDRVRWALSNNRVPHRSVGTVVGFEDGANVVVEFPMEPMLNRELVSTAEGALPVCTRIAILLPDAGWEQAMVTQTCSIMERGTECTVYKVQYDSSSRDFDIDFRNFDSKLILTRDQATLVFQSRQLEIVDEESMFYRVDEWRHHFCTDQLFFRNRLFEIGVTRLFMFYVACFLILLYIALARI